MFNISFFIAFWLLVTLNSPAYAQGLFGPRTDYVVCAVSVFSADLDGDGDNDLAVASGIGVSVLLNDGGGTFTPNGSYDAGGSSVFIADLDGYGDNDLAVANFHSNTVSVLLNNGDGTFAHKVDYETGRNPRSVFIADLDGDGDNDLAVANQFSRVILWSSVSVLLNNGDGTFAHKVDYETGRNPRSVFIADLDGDGDNDLAVANWGRFHHPGKTVSVLMNNGDGTFAYKMDYDAGWQPSSVFIADLDGDGDNDIAVANSGFTFPSAVSSLLNNGDGTFAHKVDYTAGDDPSSVFSADLDGDGDNDLAVANSGSDIVSVLFNLSATPATINE